MIHFAARGPSVRSPTSTDTMGYIARRDSQMEIPAHMTRVIGLAFVVMRPT
jgi:hypothetical protein